MWSQFFVERYAREKHRAHLREAAHDRLLVTPQPAEQRPTRRALRAQAALVLAAISALIAFARGRGPWQAAYGPSRRERMT